MKIYISADIEGIWGVVSRSHIINTEKDYERGRKLMTDEINIAVGEAFKNGAKEIVLNDSHGSMDNITIEHLHPKVKLISGQPKVLSMMEGIDNTFDGVMFIGYHPRSGSQNGIFDHTYSSRTIAEIKINGKPLGECGLNGRAAGYYGVPVIFLSGDTTVTKQAKEEIGNIETLAVKDSLSRYCAANLSRLELETKYKEKIKTAFNNISKYPIISYDGEIKLEVTFYSPIMADSAMLIPRVKREDDKSVSYISNDYIEIYKLFRVMISLAGLAFLAK